eukprot:Sspe_Gene.71104::Locus_42080_Transcript_1_1_Confidence_1.000_Length_871::g.71104::m.71104
MAGGAVPSHPPTANGHTPSPPHPRTRRRKRIRMVVDTDCGADDAAALLVALHAPHVSVEGITCVWGNVRVDQATTNACKLLDFMGMHHVPVFRGADEPLVGRQETKGWEGHGKDGFGDAGFPDAVKSPEGEHAALALVRLLKGVRRTQHEVWQLVALGPLTNVALALRICPQLLTGLGDETVPGVVVMGGAFEAKGNSNMAAEFNWHCDPEAAFIVMHAMKNRPTPQPRIWVVAWEVTVACSLTWDEYEWWVGHVPSQGDYYPRNRIQSFLRRLFARLE